MALNFAAIPAFVGRILGPNANYPQGGSVDETFDGANDGTPYTATRANDILGFLQSILLRSGFSPSGLAETALESQYLNGLSAIQNADVNFFVNPEFRVAQEFGLGAATVVNGVPIVYTLDQVYAGAVSSGSVTHTSILTAGASNLEAGVEILDSAANTGAILFGAAVEIAGALFNARNDRLVNKNLVFSFVADISANDDLDYDVFYADDSTLTNSVIIDSGTISLTTGYKTYSAPLPPVSALGTNQGIFVQLKKNAGAGNRTYTLTKFKIQEGQRATPVQSAGTDGGLQACRRYYRSRAWGQFNAVGVFTWSSSTTNNVDCYIPGFSGFRVAPTATTTGSVGDYQVDGSTGAVIAGAAAATTVSVARETVRLNFVNATFGGGTSFGLVPSAGSVLSFQLDARL